MHSSKRLKVSPRAHPVDFANRSALSDCCGARIVHAGICSQCHEYCEEEDDASHSDRFDRTAFSRADRLALTDVERPGVEFRDEDDDYAFDGVSIRSVSERR